MVRLNQGSKFSDFDTLYLRNPLSKTYRVFTQIALQEADLSDSDGKGLEPIGMRISEIPNYAAKMGISSKCVGQYRSITV